MELLVVFVSLALMAAAAVYWSGEARRSRGGFPKSRNRDRKTYMSWLCGKD